MTLAQQLSLFEKEVKTSENSYFSKILNCLNVQYTGYWHDVFGVALRRWYDSKVREEVVTLSLFSGAGGLDIGFRDAGFSIRSLVEIDDKFCETLRRNVSNHSVLGEANVHCLDICEYDASDLKKVDFIIGGPPCQTFSAAGRRAAGVAGLKDTRGTLFAEYVRLLKKLQPKGFLFENVYGITGAEEGQAWEDIKNAFEEAGYSIQYRILDAADYGVPQHRERMFIVGVKEGLNFLFPRPTHGPDSHGELRHVSASEALSGLTLEQFEVSREVNGRYGHLLNEIPPGLNYSFFTEKMGHPNPVFAWRSKFSDFLYKAHPDMPVRTIKAQGGQYTGPFHWESRPFSISEFKRLQTFPDQYQIVGGRGVAIHQIGNSVAPQQARMLAMAVLAQVFNIEPPCDINYLLPAEELSFRFRKRQLTKLYVQLAKEALEGKQPSTLNGFTESVYVAYLDKAFTLHERSQGRNNCKVNVKKFPRKYQFNLKSQESEDIKEEYELRIKPKNKKSWSFDVDFFEIRGTFCEETFVLGWRILEHELRKRKIRPDLVQLNNYYQYEPNLDIEIYLPDNFRIFDIWKAIHKITLSLCTRNIISVQKIAENWEVSVAEVLPIAQKLKELGYEIRNSNTNIQIPEGYILIPYAFPTLSKESVQRRKSLYKG